MGKIRYYLDTEFYEHQPRLGVQVIELISIGIVSEDERVLYREVAEFGWSHVPRDHWLQANVRPHLLRTEGVVRTVRDIRDDVLAFTAGEANRPEFWAYFADYDWAAFCSVFGSMVNLPRHFPKYCLDLKQEMQRLSVASHDLPKQTGQEHNAATDAWHNLIVHRAIREMA